MAGWNDGTESVIAGTGEVYVAPVGTALPASTTATLNAAFYGLGYHTEDGVSINRDPDVAEHRAWQSKHPIRREVNEDSFQLSFVLLQWNEATLPLAFGGGDITELGGGQYKFTPPTPEDGLDERALICDVADGSRKGRFIVPRGSVMEGVEASFQRTEMAGLAVTFKALQPADNSSPWYALFDDAAAFAAGS